MWCSMTMASPFSLSLMIKIPQYYGTTSPLTRSITKHCCNLFIFPFFVMTVSISLNGSINAGSFNVSTTFMPFMNPPRLPFFWEFLSIIQLLQSLVTLILLLSFRVPHTLHLCLFLLLLPLLSQFRSPLVSVLTKPRVISPPKFFMIKYMAPMMLKIF